MNPQGIPTYSENSKVSMTYKDIPENAASRESYLHVAFKGVLRDEGISFDGF